MFALIFSMLSNAQMFYLEPQIRAGAGASWNDGAFGASVSLETRISHLLYIGIGGFRSFTEGELQAIDENPQTWAALRHGIWAAPGLRIPHRYKKKGINWDLLFNVGFGVSFSDVAEQTDWLLMEPSALGGIDFLVFSNKLSAKISTKVFVYNPYLPEFREAYILARPQVAFEISYKL